MSVTQYRSHLGFVDIAISLCSEIGQMISCNSTVARTHTGQYAIRWENDAERR